MLESILNAEQKLQLINGLALGHYSLLLGAGASAGAIGGDGKPLPIGNALANDIISDFNLGGYEANVRLVDAYDSAQDEKNRFGQNIIEYMQSRFTNCQPSWQSILAEFTWHRVWTLNIDDVVEQAYGAATTKPMQIATPYSWLTPFADPDQQKGELQIVHLHGYADKMSTQSDLVFSHPQYLRAYDSRQSWRQIFGEQIQTTPFIIVGATLKDEIDLIDFWINGLESEKMTKMPTLIVLKEYSARDEKRFVKWGAIPVKGIADQFFKEIREWLSSASIEMPPRKDGLVHNNLTRLERIFLNQFRWLRIDAKVSEMKGHDFYGGSEPTWADILSERDALREMANDITKDILDNQGKPVQYAYCLEGDAGTGKSALILRIAHNLTLHGYEIYKFNGEERLDIGTVGNWLSRYPNTILLFDGVADFVDDIGAVIRECEKNGIGITILVTERNSRMLRVYENIPVDHIKEYRLRNLTDNDINAMIEKLQNSRRLGKITRWFPREQFDYFRREAGRDLFLGMMGLEGSMIFRTRFATMFRDEIHSDKARALYIMVCMVSAIGYSLPNAIACAASSVTASCLVELLEKPNELSGKVFQNSKGLHARHRMIASSIIDHAANNNQKYNELVALLRALAPYVNQNTIRQKTLAYRIARELMDADIVMGWIGGDLCKHVYEELSSEYNWNARFWEQRALMEAHLKNFSAARSYSEEAVHLRTDAFSLTTLGRILMEMAIKYYQPGTSESISTFWEGVSQLNDARKKYNARSAHPYITFLRYTLDFSRHTRDLEIDTDKLSREWDVWMREALSMDWAGFPHYRKQLDDFRNQWLNQVTHNHET